MRFTEMPFDAVKNILEYMPPETLITLRDVSKPMRVMVDDYVRLLVEDQELQDSEGTKLRYLEYRPEPAEILEYWEHNTFTRNVAPLSVEEAAAKAAAKAQMFDTMLTPAVSYEEDPQAFSDHFRDRLGLYAEILEGGYGSEELNADLYPYFQGLIRTGRLVDATTSNPLKTGTPVSQVMQRLLNGQARWISPEDAAGRAEAFDDLLTPAVSFEENPQAFNDHVQSWLADYAELLKKGGSGAEGLEAALRFYFQGLIRQGRLVDAATSKPLPNGTPVSKVMERLLNGQARWISPQT